MAKNKNLTQAKKAKNDEFDWSKLTPSQKAEKKYELKHRVPDSEFLKELRNPYIPEEWFQIKDFPNYYINKEGIIYFVGDVSNQRFRRKSRFVKPTLLKIGYYKVCLNKEFKLLHRIIAQTFIPNPLNYNEIDHIDGNPKNNQISNLRWVSHRENMNNPVSCKKNSNSHLGLPSNIVGRKKVWIDKSNKIYKMI